MCVYVWDDYGTVCKSCQATRFFFQSDSTEVPLDGTLAAGWWSRITWLVNVFLSENGLPLQSIPPHNYGTSMNITISSRSIIENKLFSWITFHCYVRLPESIIFAAGKALQFAHLICWSGRCCRCCGAVLYGTAVQPFPVVAYVWYVWYGMLGMVW